MHTLTDFGPARQHASWSRLGAFVVLAAALMFPCTASAQGWDGTVGLGYAWQNASGSKDSFRTQQDLRSGFMLEELNLTMVSQQAEVRAVVPENETEALLLRYLSHEPIHVDELGRASGLPIAQVTGTLALMELKGLVRQAGGMNYVLARESEIAYTVD